MLDRHPTTGLQPPFSFHLVFGIRVSVCSPRIPCICDPLASAVLSSWDSNDTSRAQGWYKHFQSQQLGSGGRRIRGLRPASATLESCLKKKFRIPAEGSSTYSLHLPGDPEMSPWGEIRPCLTVLEGGACNQAEKSEV